MNILDLSGRLGIEVDELLASWGICGFLVVGGQSSKEGVGPSSHSIGVVDRSSLVGGMVFRVDVGQSLNKAVGYSVLLIELDGTLDGLVANNITVGKIFGDNAAAWFLFLGDLVAVALSLLFVMTSIIFATASGAGDVNLCGTKLSVIEEQGSLSRGFLLESYGGILSRLSFGDVKAGNLAAAGSQWMII